MSLLSDPKRVEVHVSGSYRNGDVIAEDLRIPADLIFRKSPTPQYMWVTLRMALPLDMAADLEDGVQTGRIDLTFEQMAAPVERT